MISPSSDAQKKEAFRLFEDGRYDESLRICRAILSREKDQAIEVLAATTLFSSGNHDEAETCFRDLSQRMPESSYVHSYLAKVLEARGDEAAVAEYALAVHLDPANQDALRSYAGCLLAHGDFRGSLPVLRRLAQATKRAEDVLSLVRALTMAGEADEALAAFNLLGDHAAPVPEYIDALLAAGQHRPAADAARTLWQATGEPAVFARYLDALSRCDLPAAMNAAAEYLRGQYDPEILSILVRLLRAGGRPADALTALRSEPRLATTPAGRLAACELLEESGRDEEALAAYENLVRDELTTKDELGFLQDAIGRYRTFLLRTREVADARARFTKLVSQDANVASLAETGRLYEDTGDPAGARSWYYRAYRADFLAGGLLYARFLAQNGECRECEKVLLYIVSNVKKGSDLVRIARTVLDRECRMYRLFRLMDQLIHALEARQATLDSEGRDVLAMAYFLAASNALETMDYASCKQRCLAGMDFLPVPPRALRLEDFLDLLRACKARAAVDRPVLTQRQVRRRAVTKPAAPDLEKILPDLTEQERAVLAFLRTHRKASEMDLRNLLGTRRVAGVVNQLLRKAAAAGIPVIEKKGMGEDGEIYEYAGT